MGRCPRLTWPLRVGFTLVWHALSLRRECLLGPTPCAESGRATRTVLASILAFLLGAAFMPARGDGAAGPSWVHWRGPSGQGQVDDSRVPLTWSESRNMVWKTALPGRGNSTPVIWGNRIFLTAASKDGRERYVLCVDRSDGKILWQRTSARVPMPGKSHLWNGYASASCTCDGQRVYAFFGTPGLFCYDFAGKLLWQHGFGIFTSETGWGTAASPFLFDDLVIQNCDNDGPKFLPKGHDLKEAAPMALVALDKVTGKVRWQTPRNQGRGFSTPRLVMAPGGRLDLVLNGPRGVWAYDPRSGEEIWHCRRTDAKDLAKFGEPVPVSDGKTLFAPSGRPGPFQAIPLGGTGDLTSQVLWQVGRKGRDVASQVLWQGRLYAADNKAILTCFDARSGKVLSTQRLAPGGQVLSSPLVVRGKLLFILDTGETVVLEPGPRPKVISRNVLGEGQALDFAASPAVVDGRLFLRSQSHLYCIGAKE
jgi:outer membrane protein assembly factor BamB